ncbi:hypothetical protein [Azospirillum argentinense]
MGVNRAGRGAPWPGSSTGSTPGLAARACPATGLRLGNRPNRAAGERRRTSGRAGYPAAYKGRLKRSWCPRPVTGGAPSLLHLPRSCGFGTASRNREVGVAARNRWWHPRTIRTRAPRSACGNRQIRI